MGFLVESNWNSLHLHSMLQPLCNINYTPLLMLDPPGTLNHIQWVISSLCILPASVVRPWMSNRTSNTRTKVVNFPCIHALRRPSCFSRRSRGHIGLSLVTFEAHALYVVHVPDICFHYSFRRWGPRTYTVAFEDFFVSAVAVNTYMQDNCSRRLGIIAWAENF